MGKTKDNQKKTSLPKEEKQLEDELKKSEVESTKGGKLNRTPKKKI